MILKGTMITVFIQFHKIDKSIRLTLSEKNLKTSIKNLAIARKDMEIKVPGLGRDQVKVSLRVLNSVKMHLCNNSHGMMMWLLIIKMMKTMQIH